MRPHSEQRWKRTDTAAVNPSQGTFSTFIIHVSWGRLLLMLNHCSRG